MADKLDVLDTRAVDIALDVVDTTASNAVAILGNTAYVGVRKDSADSKDDDVVQDDKDKEVKHLVESTTSTMSIQGVEASWKSRDFIEVDFKLVGGGLQGAVTQKAAVVSMDSSGSFIMH